MESQLLQGQENKQLKNYGKFDSIPSDIEDFSDRLIPWFCGFEKTDINYVPATLFAGVHCDSELKKNVMSVIENLNEEFTDEEECQLEAHYRINPNPSSEDMQELALQVEKNKFSVKSWFRRRSAYDVLRQADKFENVMPDENSNIKISEKDAKEDPVEVEKKTLLKSLFQINSYPTRNQIRGLSTAMNLSTWIIDEWFYECRTMDRCQDKQKSLDDNRDYNVNLRERFLPVPLTDRHFTWSENDFLEMYIEINPKPSLMQIEQIADLLSVDCILVEEWFIEHRKINFKSQSVGKKDSSSDEDL